MWEGGKELGLSGEVDAQEPELRVKWGISRARGKARGEVESRDGIRTGISLCPESARPSAGLRAVGGGRATLGVGNRESREAISLGVCVAGGWRGTQGGAARVGVGRSGAGGPLSGQGADFDCCESSPGLSASLAARRQSRTLRISSFCGQFSTA